MRQGERGGDGEREEREVKGWRHREREVKRGMGERGEGRERGRDGVREGGRVIEI